MCFQLCDFVSACVVFRRSEGGSRDSGGIRRSMEHEIYVGFVMMLRLSNLCLLPSVADHCGDDRNLLSHIQRKKIHLVIKFAHVKKLASFFLTSSFHLFIYFLSYYFFLEEREERYRDQIQEDHDRRIVLKNTYYLGSLHLLNKAVCLIGLQDRF